LNHPGGTTKAAMEFIDGAIEASSKASPALFHTKATVFKALGKQEGISSSLRDRYLDEALGLLQRHGGLKHNYTAGSICEILLFQAKRRIRELDAGEGQRLEDEAAVRKLTELERALDESLQRFPGDNVIVTHRAELHAALAEQPKAIALLKRAHDANPANEQVALRLARQHVDKGERAEAIQVLRRAANLNPGSKTLSFELAQNLMADGELNHVSEISGLLRRSFTEGDSHFEAQFWHARHEFLYGERERAERVYQQFTKRTHPYVDVGKRRAAVRSPDGSFKLYDGSVKSIQGDFAFVRAQDLAGSVYLHRTEIEGYDWGSMRVGDQLRFRLGFSFRGPAAMSAQPL